MTVIYRGSSTPGSANNATTITLTQDIPALANGDYMLMAIYTNSHTAPLPTPPAGWTLIDGDVAADYVVQVFGRIAASEPGSYTITKNAGTKVYGGIVLAFYSGSAQTLYVDAHANQVNASSTDRTMPGVTTTQASAGLAGFFASSGNVGATPPAGMTERLDTLFSFGVRAYAATSILTSAGATGDKVATTSSAFTSRAVTVAIAESSGISGTLAVTLDAATLAATGTLAITGSLARTLADATLAATGQLAISGALTKTLADATLAASGSLGVLHSILVRSVSLSSPSTGTSHIFVPPAAEEGDLLVLHIGIKTSVAFDSLSGPDGWDALYGFINGAIDHNITSFVYTRRATASESSTYIIYFDGTYTASGVVLAIYSTTANPVYVADVDARGSNTPDPGEEFSDELTTNFVFASVDAPAEDDLLLYLGMSSSDMNVDEDASVIEQWDFGNPRLFGATARAPSAGASPEYTATSVESSYHAFSLAIAELPPILATLDVTLDDATLDASGALALTGALAVTLADVTLAAMGYQGHSATLAVTLANATLAATMVHDPPAAPSDLTATTISPTQIDLAWTDNASGESGFVLERSLDGTSGWTLVVNPAADATSYSHTGLLPGTTYHYRLAAVGIGGRSSYAYAVATTDPPTEAVFVTNNAWMRLYWHRPAVVLAARVNMPTVTYPVMVVVVDGVTEGAVVDVQTDMFFTIGSAEGLDDYGRGRIRALDAPSDTLFVNRSSQGKEDGELTVVDDAFVTVYDDFRVMSKVPYIDPTTGTQYKDSGITVGSYDYAHKPPPVANCGPGMAGNIDPESGLLSVAFDGSASFTVADGATIASYAWDIKDGTVTAGTLASATLTVDFPAGFRWVALTVVDSNSQPHTARCPVFARDPDDDLCVQNWQMPSEERAWSGSAVHVKLLGDLPRSDYMDGALCLIWDNDYPEPDQRSHMRMIGWHQSDVVNLRAEELGLKRETTVEIVDVAGRLAKLPGWSQLLKRIDADKPVTWSTMENPTLDKYIHLLLQWHSTALSLADYFPSGTGDDYQFVIFQTDAGTLYEQVQRKAQQFIPDRWFTCNRLGQLQILPNPNLQNVADRTSVVQGAFTEAWWSELGYNYTRPPKVSWLRCSCLLALDDWVIVDGEKTLLTAFCIAPGSGPSQGEQEITRGEQLAISAQALYDCTGHRLAQLNSRYGEITLASPGGGDAGVDPANMTWVEVSAGPDTAPQRGLDFATVRALPLAVSVSYSYGETGITRRASLRLQLETIGRPGVEEVRKVAEDPNL